MQFFGLVNLLLANNPVTSRNNLSIQVPGRIFD
jgi:phosphatidylinositol kinase/protein kinase (PI-3  family)